MYNVFKGLKESNDEKKQLKKKKKTLAANSEHKDIDGKV